MKSKLPVTLLCLTVLLAGASGHGRLMEPAARNAMWRFGFPNPVNYNDNELYCGGFSVQYEKNGGKCGVCGDNYVETVPRSHESGGIFGNAIIVKRYVSGQVIDIEADLTTNHKGRMEVRFCPNNNPNKIITQECLDKYVLPVVDTGGASFIIPEDSPKTIVFRWKVKLPEGITCTNCVIQWKYFAGNTWGKDKLTGEVAQGKGPQETFVNCADIYITTNTGHSPPSHNEVENPWALYFRGLFPGMPHDPHTKPADNGLKPLVVRSQLCQARSSYATVRGMHDYCKTNCMKYPPNCNPDICYCVVDCKAIGKLAEQKDSDVYCHQVCLKYPSDCPPDKCVCS